jgi:hypothetical protein
MPSDEPGEANGARCASRVVTVAASVLVARPGEAAAGIVHRVCREQQRAVGQRV